MAFLAMITSAAGQEKPASIAGPLVAQCLKYKTDMSDLVAPNISAVFSPFATQKIANDAPFGFVYKNLAPKAKYLSAYSMNYSGKNMWGNKFSATIFCYYYMNKDQNVFLSRLVIDEDGNASRLEAGIMLGDVKTKLDELP